MSLLSQIADVVNAFEQASVQWSGDGQYGMSQAHAANSKSAFLITTLFNTVNLLSQNLFFSSSGIKQLKLTSRKIVCISRKINGKVAEVDWKILLQSTQEYLRKILIRWNKEPNALHLDDFFYHLACEIEQIQTSAPQIELPSTHLLLKAHLGKQISPYKVLRLATTYFQDQLFQTLWTDKNFSYTSCVYNTLLIGHLFLDPFTAEVQRKIAETSFVKKLKIDQKNYQVIDLFAGLPISRAGYQDQTKEINQFHTKFLHCESMEDHQDLTDTGSIQSYDYNKKTFQFFRSMLLEKDLLKIAKDHHILYQVFLKLNKKIFLHTFTIELFLDRKSMYPKARIYQTFRETFNLTQYFDQVAADNGIMSLDQLREFVDDLEKIICTSKLSSQQISERQRLITKCFHAPTNFKGPFIQLSENNAGETSISGLSFYFFSQIIHGTAPFYNLAFLIDQSPSRKSILQSLALALTQLTSQ